MRGRADASDNGGLDLELPLLASDPDEPLDDIESVGVWYDSPLLEIFVLLGTWTGGVAWGRSPILASSWPGLCR